MNPMNECERFIYGGKNLHFDGEKVAPACTTLENKLKMNENIFNFSTCSLRSLFPFPLPNLNVWRVLVNVWLKYGAYVDRILNIWSACGAHNECIAWYVQHPLHAPNTRSHSLLELHIRSISESY